MSQFVLEKNEDRASEDKVVTFAKTSRKQKLLLVKLTVFIAAFFGMLHLSMTNGNIMLPELSIVGGIFTLLSLIHIKTNQ